MLSKTSTARRIFAASALVAFGVGAFGGVGAPFETPTQTSNSTAPARRADAVTAASTPTPLAVGEEETPISIIAETTEQEDTVRWALGRFEAAGLQLPTLTIYMHENRADCGGNNGSMGDLPNGEYVIHSCGVDFTLLHELTHAWDMHQLDDETRAKFLELAKADVWRNPDSWHLSGAEHAANVVAWGLMDERINQTRTRPYDHRSMLRGFRILTGQEPLWLADA